MNIFGAINDGLARLTDWFFSWFGEDPRVERIRQMVATSCHFLPTAASVIAMLNATNPAVTGVVGIATAICQAVTASRARMTFAETGVLGTVNGVPIEGEDLKGGGK